MDISEERLITLILENRNDLTREKLEDLIDEKVNELKISRKTALYLLMIEFGISVSSPIERRIKFTELTEGLSNINIVGRLLWIKSTERYNDTLVTRGGIMDDTLILPILFWNRSEEDIRTHGFKEGDIIEISGAYTRGGLSGVIEIHVPARAKIDYYRENIDIPSVLEVLTPLDQDISKMPLINTYGKILTPLNERVVKVGEEEIRVASFLIGYNRSFRRIVLWRNIIDNYRWIKPGKKIILFLGKVKINKFGEAEIHLTRNSHIIEENSINIPLIIEKKRLIDVKPGLNLSKVEALLLAKGVSRISTEKNMIIRSVLIADDTHEATLVLKGDKVREIEEIENGEGIEISIFRASIKGDSIIIFVDDATVIQKVPMSRVRPVIKISTKSVDELSIEDKIINIRGKIVKGPLKADDYSDIQFFLAEDEGGKPFKIVFRGSLTEYASETIKEGDSIFVEAGLLDLYPLLIKKEMPSIKLRAFSRIRKL